MLIMSGKMARLGLLKLNVFCKKNYDVIISVHGITTKILPRDSNYIVYVVMRPKFGDVREVIVTTIL